MSQKKHILTLVLAILITSVTVSSVHAAKRRLPRASAININTTRASLSSPSVKVAFSDDRNAVTFTVSSLSSLSLIAYDFTYKSNGTTQGINGTVTDMSTDPATRELLFGTCSAGICRYDTDITDAKLTLTLTSTNGLKRVKTYILRK